MDELAAWLERAGLSRYRSALEENEIELSDLPHLTDEDLKEIGLPVGPRRRLIVAAQSLAGRQDPALGAAFNDPSASLRRGEAERRQLTVMFVDMVGSTELSARLDPEDLRVVVRRYQDAVAGAVSRYGGHVAKYLGDGVLAYFGWPQAYEDQAERSVRSALEIISDIGVSHIEQDDDVAVRVGIATGEVVVGDLVGESGLDAEAVSGVTPNLAARLEQVAEPGQIVVSDATRRLLGAAFDLEDLGGQRLKGFSERVPAWLITGAAKVGSRFEATRGTDIEKLVGRDSELHMLSDRWRLAVEGEGQAVLISGEAGIGKSRLVQALREETISDAPLRIQYQCSPYHVNSALYPTIQQLEWAAGFQPDDTNEQKLDKLEAVIGTAGGLASERMALFSQLLSLSDNGRYRSLEGSARQIKERLLEALVGYLMDLAADRPVLFIFEDAHWIDPTSEELLAAVVETIRSYSVLAVITHRPEWSPDFPRHEYVSTLHLNRLGRAYGAEIVKEVMGSVASEAAIERIVMRADGVPLFIEELTRSLVERGIGAPEDEVPETLQASLQARIDRLPETARRLAQIGAVVGREFTPELVTAASDMSALELEDALDGLARSDIVRAIGRAGERRLLFRHALIQEAAYASLLRSRREEIHGRLADWVAANPSQSTPEVAARHLSAARRHYEAAKAWEIAGSVALERSGMAEAVAAFEHAIDELHQLPSTDELKQTELTLLIRLGVAVTNSLGPASPKAEEVQRRASVLAQDVDDREIWFRVQWGLWRIHNVRSEFSRSIPIANELLKDAVFRNDPDSELQAHHALWSSHLFHGNLAATCHHADRALELYHTERHRDQAMQFGGHDVRECGLVNSGNALFAMGFAEQAIDRNRRGIEHAKLLEHPQVVGHSYNWAIILPQQLDDIGTLTQRIEFIAPIIRRNGLEIYFTEVELLRAWLAVRTEADASVVERMRELYDRRREMGTLFVHTYFLALIADACLRLGKHQDALRTAIEGIESAKRTGEKFFLAELYRYKAAALVAEDGRNIGAAEQALKSAIDDAAGRSARTFEIRSATQLAQLWCDAGRGNDARSLLSPIYDAFEEGFDTKDLKSARSLLEQM